MKISQMTMTHKLIFTWWVSILALIFILFPSESQIVNAFRIIFWSIFLLFLPGRWITQAILEENEIDMLERLALSFALSISVIPLITFYTNLAGVKISAVMVWTITCLVCLWSWIYISFFKKEKVEMQQAQEK